MEITSPCVVALTWTLKDTLGELLDELDEPIEFFVGGDDLLVKIEEALMGYGAGASLDLHLEPEEAFGDYDEMLVFFRKALAFSKGVRRGYDDRGSCSPQRVQPRGAQRSFLHSN